MPRIVSIFTIISSMTAAVSALAICYYPDGVTIEPGHVPCNQTTSSPSACCDPLDSCSVSGICLGRSGWIYRGSCTDVTWGSSNCAATQWDQCITDPSENKRYSAFTPMWTCSTRGTGDTDYFCCAYGNGSNCCASEFSLGVTGAAFKPGYDAFVQNITSEAAGSANSSCTANGTTSGATNGTSSSTSSKNGDLGTKVGLGVGIPLGALVAGLLGFLFYRESSKSHRRNSAIAIPAYSSVDQQGSSMRGNSSAGGFGQANAENHRSDIGTIYPAGSPQAPKTDVYNPATSIYEAPASNAVHELRG